MTLGICSRGGDLNACFALVDVMKGSKIPIKTVGLGMIASCGLLMFITGTKGRRVLTPNTSILSHQYSWGSIGKEHELFARVKELELTTERMINHPKDVVGEGDKVRVKILRIEPERRRLGLSLRQADADELTSSDGGRMTGGAALQDSSENRPDIDQAPYVHDNEELQNPINIDAEQFAKDAEPEQDQTVE